METLESLELQSSAITSRLCRVCRRKNLKQNYRFKACPDCLEKERKRNRQKLAPLRDERFNIHNMDDTIILDDSEAGPGAFPVKAPQKGADTTDAGEQSTEQFSKMKKMKRRLKTNKENSPASSTELKDLPPSDGAEREYRTATEMYYVLKQLCLRQLQLRYVRGFKGLRFRGCYSIVSTTGMDESVRAKLVTKDLRKIAKISFKRKQRSTGPGKLTFKCKCYRDIQLDVHNSPSLNERLLHNQSSAGTARKGRQDESAVGAPSGHAVAPCGGLVTICVENDQSHFLGIPGQKITVIVQH